MTRMIDLSQFNVDNGPIDFAKVKASGVEAVMLRIGWAGYDGSIKQDISLPDSIEQAAAAGLGVGLYLYTYTEGPDAARNAAKQAVAIADRFAGRITYPIAFDVEETNLTSLTDQGRAGLTETVAAFCQQVQQLGYYAMWYTYTAFALEHLDVDGLADYDLWIADYRGNPSLPRQELGRNFGIWQYEGQNGRCPGVTGPCDRDRAYKNYPRIIRAAGLNRLEPDPDHPDQPGPPEQARLSLEELEALLYKDHQPQWLIDSLEGFTAWLQRTYGITGLDWA